MTYNHCIWQRLVCAVLCLVCLFVLCTPVAAVRKEPRAVEYPQYTKTSLVHNRARYGAAVIGQMEEGTQLTVLEESGDFYKIDCYDMTGYIAKTQTRQEKGVYYVSCDPDSPETGSMELKKIASAMQLRASLLALAQKQLGARYVYGRSAPGGFDCSGLTTYVFKSHDIALERCADDQMQNGLIVAKSGMQVGDLVFFRESGSPYLATHVGIYAGDGKMIHSDSKGVCYDDLYSGYYERTFVGARRIVNTAAPELELTTAATATVARTAGIRNAN